MLLAVDDLHWADAPSVRALNYLAGRIAELPVLIVVALRPGESTGVADLIRPLHSSPDAQRLELPRSARRASPGSCARASRTPAMSCATRSPRRAAATPSTCASCCGPWPRAATSPRRPRWRAAALIGVGDHVLARLRSLGPAAPELAMAMAVMGASGRLDHAAAVAGLGPGTAAEAALAMRRVEILAAEDPFQWIHPLVRRSLYDGLSVTRRDALHARPRRSWRTRALRPAWSPRTWPLSGRRDRPPSCRGCSPPSTRRCRATRPTSRSICSGGRWPRTRGSGSRCCSGSGRSRSAGAVRPRSRCSARRRSWPTIRAIGRWPRCGWARSSPMWATTRRPSRRSATDSPSSDGFDPDLALELEVARAVSFAFDPMLAPQLWEDRPRLHALAERDAWPAGALSALLALTYAFRGERLDEIPALCEQALQGGRLLAERGAGAWTPAHVMGALTTVEAYDRALALADEVEAAARSQGAVSNVLLAEGVRGDVAGRRGDLAGAEEILRPLAETSQSIGWLLGLITALWWMGDVILERAANDDLADLLDSFEVPPGFEAVAPGAWALVVRGRVRALRGRRDEAVRGPARGRGGVRRARIRRDARPVAFGSGARAARLRARGGPGARRRGAPAGRGDRVRAPARGRAAGERAAHRRRCRDRAAARSRRGCWPRPPRAITMPARRSTSARRCAAVAG